MKADVPNEMQTLYKATLDLHHQAEEHPFGAAMSSGELSCQEWADWCGAMQQIYYTLDPFLPPSLKRADDLFLDILSLVPRGVVPYHSVVAQDFCDDVVSNPSQIGIIAGMAYVLSGANLRGGQVIKKTLMKKGYPCNHLTFTISEREDAEEWLSSLRAVSKDGNVDHENIAPVVHGSQIAFKKVIWIMDEIWNRNSNDRSNDDE